jgi:hypothetical protein
MTSIVAEAFASLSLAELALPVTALRIAFDSLYGADTRHVALDAVAVPVWGKLTGTASGLHGGSWAYTDTHHCVPPNLWRNRAQNNKFGATNLWPGGHFATSFAGACTVEVCEGLCEAADAGCGAACAAMPAAMLAAGVTGQQFVAGTAAGAHELLKTRPGVHTGPGRSGHFVAGPRLWPPLNPHAFSPAVVPCTLSP